MADLLVPIKKIPNWPIKTTYLGRLQLQLDYVLSPSLGTQPKWHHFGTLVFFLTLCYLHSNHFGSIGLSRFCCFSSPSSCKEESEDSCFVTLHSDHSRLLCSLIKLSHHTPVLVTSHPLPTWGPNIAAGTHTTNPICFALHL